MGVVVLHFRWSFVYPEEKLAVPYGKIRNSLFSTIIEKNWKKWKVLDNEWNDFTRYFI